MQPPEDCDDGNLNDGDFCSNVCDFQPGENCGNGVVDFGEACDDGDDIDNNGCSNDCQAGGVLCPNGFLDAGEQCDDGNANDADGCNNACQNQGGPNCGNAHVDAGEQCDDGNNVNGDACDNACQLPVGGQCLGNECANGGNAACAAQNAVCQHINQLPCIQCAPAVGGQCDGTECANGGAAACALSGEECSLTDELPCMTCIPKNGCGNGRIDPIDPPGDDGGDDGGGGDDDGDESCNCMGSSECRDLGGTSVSHQGCLYDANGNGIVESSEDGICCSVGGGEEPPQGCVQSAPPPPCTCSGLVLDPGCPYVFFRNPCAPICPGANLLGASVLGAQTGVDGDGNPMPAGCFCTGRVLNSGCPVDYFRNPCEPLGTQCTRDVQRCCDASGNETGSIGRDPANNCAFFPCPAGSNACGGGDNGDVGGDDGGGGGGGDDGEMEECDDGNRNDNDGCGNDCKINCQEDLDCPDAAACVDGDCVDQCVEPPGDTGGDDGGLGGTGGPCVVDADCVPANVPVCNECRVVDGGFGCGKYCSGAGDYFCRVGVCKFRQNLVRCDPGECVQASAPEDFLSRLMASQKSNRFKLFP